MRAKTWLVLIVVVICLMLAAHAQAAASPGYQVNWLTVASGGGGSAASAHYAVDVSVGQTAIGEGLSTHYRGAWGFLAGLDALWRIVVPLVLR